MTRSKPEIVEVDTDQLEAQLLDPSGNVRAVYTVP
jgi:hypothetical protein